MVERRISHSGGSRNLCDWMPVFTGMTNVKNLCYSLLFVCLFLFCGITGLYAENSVERTRELYVFYTPSCHKCTEVKSRIIPQIEKKFKGVIQIDYYDIAEVENFKLLLSLQKKYDAKFEIIPPVFFMGGSFFKGDIFKLSDYERFIIRSLAGQVKEPGHLPQVNLVEQFKEIRPLAVISAGLIDGINPCAFTVIVFFMSFLALQGYKKQELTVIGLAFIFAVFITYILIGIGLFGFLYRMKDFPLISRIFNLSVGVFSILLGILAMYDFFKYKKTGSTEGLILQLPEPVKRQIHSVIGLHYRKAGEEKKQAQGGHMVKLLISALVTGFLVSILEAICTGQVYLPTIAFVLKTTSLKFQALGYLLLYNFMFIVPLFLIFVFSLLGVSSGQFAAVLKKHLLTVKILMAALFFGLAIFLLTGRR